MNFSCFIYRLGFLCSLSQITTSLSLMRRLPPHKIEVNLTGLLNLIPEETDEILQRVDQPLKQDVDNVRQATTLS